MFRHNREQTHVLVHLVIAAGLGVVPSPLRSAPLRRESVCLPLGILAKRLGRDFGAAIVLVGASCVRSVVELVE